MNNGDSRIYVSPRYKKRLTNRHKKFNGFFKKKTGKNISFVDFTDLLANAEEDGSIFLINPLKRGRKTARIRKDPLDALFDL